MTDRIIGAHADHSRDDFIFPRQRSDWAWTEFERSPRLYSKAEYITGYLIVVAVACLGMVVAYDAWRLFAALTN